MWKKHRLPPFDRRNLCNELLGKGPRWVADMPVPEDYTPERAAQEWKARCDAFKAERAAAFDKLAMAGEALVAKQGESIWQKRTRRFQRMRGRMAALDQASPNPKRQETGKRIAEEEGGEGGMTYASLEKWALYNEVLLTSVGGKDEWTVCTWRGDFTSEECRHFILHVRAGGREVCFESCGEACSGRMVYHGHGRFLMSRGATVDLVTPPRSTDAIWFAVRKPSSGAAAGEETEETNEEMTRGSSPAAEGWVSFESLAHPRRFLTASPDLPRLQTTLASSEGSFARDSTWRLVLAIGGETLPRSRSVLRILEEQKPKPGRQTPAGLADLTGMRARPWSLAPRCIFHCCKLRQLPWEQTRE